MKIFSSVNVCKLFWGDDRGSVFPLIGVLVTVLVGATGVAVDTGRAQLVQSRLSSSLDAAGLAAGSTISTQSAQAEVEKYLNVNFNNYMGAHLEDVTVTVSADNKTITLSASARLPTTFMQVVGQVDIVVSAASEIERNNPGNGGATNGVGLELVMVLDNTGSMAGTKLTNLKTSAKDLVNILYGTNTTVENLWIGIVPFAQAVNVGTSHTDWVATDSFTWGTASWGGCVDARESSNRDVTDDPPSVALFPKYYWPCDDNNKWYGDNTNKNNCDLNNKTKYKSTSTSLGPNKSCSQEVTRMTGNKNTVIAAIDAMQATGNTHINLGAAWGWRMLSPRWRGLWGGDMNSNNLPLDYNTEQMKKVAIIMTDGDNTISNGAHGAYWYLSDGKLGTTNQSTAENRLDSRLTTVCSSMKANNIIVYTITFGTIAESTKTMMQNCASQTDYYFQSVSSTDLQNAFLAIGDSLSNLRVSR